MQAAVSIPKHCDGIRRDGARCGAPARSDGAYCFAHDPARAHERTEARRKGGRHRSSAVRLRALVPPRLVPVYERLEAALDEVHQGTIDPRVASAMAGLARAMVAVLTAGEMEERVRRLEEATGGNRRAI